MMMVHLIHKHLQLLLIWLLQPEIQPIITYILSEAARPAGQTVRPAATTVSFSSDHCRQPFDHVIIPNFLNARLVIKKYHVW